MSRCINQEGEVMDVKAYQKRLASLLDEVEIILNQEEDNEDE